MLGFYVVRKLIEAAKLSDSTVTQLIPVTAFLSSGKLVTLINWHNIDQLYDLENPVTEPRDLLFVCHQIVHSYIFIPLFSEDGLSLSGILFNSDRHRNDRLYCVELDQIIELFEKVGNDYPHKMTRTFNERKKDYDVKSS